MFLRFFYGTQYSLLSRLLIHGNGPSFTRNVNYHVVCTTPHKNEGGKTKGNAATRQNKVVESGWIQPAIGGRKSKNSTENGTLFPTLTPKQQKQADTNGGFQMISRLQSYQESIVCGPGSLPENKQNAT
jgi:hypothetical protein